MQEDIQLTGEENKVFQNTFTKLASPSEPEAQQVAAEYSPTQSAYNQTQEFWQMGQEGQQVESNIEDIRRSDHELNYEKTKQLMHDVAYRDSAEFAAKNLARTAQYERAYSQTLTPEQANALSKELGSDIKFERNVTEGKVRLAVERNQQKSYLESQLASYQERGEYSAWENMMIGCSAISGSVGAAEFLGTTALSVGLAAAGGAVAGSGAIASLAGILPSARKAQVGISLAQKAIIAEKRAKEIGNAVAGITKYAQKAKKSGGISSLAFDSYRMTQGAAGAHASAVTTAVPFAVDAMVSDMPRVALMSANNANMQDDSFTTKDALAEMLMAGSMGAALPLAGSLAKPVTSVTRKALEGISESISTKVRKRAVESVMTGKGSDEEIARMAEQMYQDADQVQRIIAQPSTSPALEQAATTIAGENLKPEEFTALWEYVGRCLTGHNSHVPRVDELPFKTKFLSNYPGMYNFLDSAVKRGATNTEIFNDMLAKQVPLVGHGKAALEDGVMPTLQIQGEGGALGRVGASGFNREQAQDFLVNVYRAHLCGDEQARALATESLERMKKAKILIDRIIDTYDELFDASKRGAPRDQSTAYTLLNGKQTNFETALREAVTYMGSPTDGQAYINAEKILKNKEVAEAIKGHPELAEQYGVNVAEEVLAQREALMGQIAGLDKKGYFDLIQRPGTKGETAFLKELSDEVALAIENNSDLLNSDLLFQKKYGSHPEKMLEQMQGLNLPEQRFSFGGERTTQKEVTEMTKGSQAYQASAERLQSTKAILDETTAEMDLTLEELRAGKKVQPAPQTDGVLEKPAPRKDSVFDLFIRAAGNISTRKSEGTRSIGSYYHTLSETIVRTQSLLNDGLSKVSKNLISALQDSKFFSETMFEINSPKRLAQALKGRDGVLRQAINTSIVEPLKAEMEGFAKSGDKLYSAVDEAIDRFINRIESDKDSIKVLTTKVERMTPEQASTKLAEEGGDAVERALSEGQAIEKLTEQEKILSDILAPIQEELAIILQDEQNLAMQTQARLLQDFKAMLINPSMGYEVLMSRLTFTPLNIAGSALSVENLANPSDVMRMFDQKLFLKTPGTTTTDKILGQGRDLRAYAYDPENFEGISKAIRDIVSYGDATEVKKAGIQLNDQDAVVAQAYLDTMAGLQKSLYSVGSGKVNPVHFFDSAALAQANHLIPDDIGQAVSDSVNRVLGGSKYKKIKAAFARFTPQNIQETEKTGTAYLSKREAARAASQNASEANLALYLFRDLDLDRHFNSSQLNNLSYNTVRDVFFSNDPKALDRLVRKYGEDKIAKAITKISHHISGNTDPAKASSGLIKQLGVGTKRVTDLYNSGRSKFLEDLEEKVFFKNEEATREASRYFGHRDLRSWFEKDFRAAKGAYAVLKNVGAEPIKYVEDLAGTFNTFLSQDGERLLGRQATEKSILTPRQIQSLKANCRTTCGIESIPASSFVRAARVLAKIASSTLIVKAGVKSLTDYFYQHQMLITNGLKQGADMGAVANTIGRMANVLKSPDLANHLFLNHALANGTLQNMLADAGLNVDTLAKETHGLRGIREAIQRERAYNKFTPALVKWENHAREFSDFFINNIAWVGPITEYNRSNAAMSIMEAVGAFAAEKDFATIAKENPRLIGMLSRHGVTQYEWDNLFRKCVSTVDDYTEKWFGEKVGFMGDHKLFFAEMMNEIDDSVLSKAILDQNPAVTEVTQKMIDDYRLALCDKASVMINAGANEMTSLPTARAQNALNLYTRAGTGPGEIVRMATQYQSFSMAVTQMHWGRKLAQHVDMNNPLYDHLLTSAMSSDTGAAGDLTGFLIQNMLLDAMMVEGLSYATGTHKTVENSKSKTGNLPEKLGRYLTDSLGIFGPVYDAITSSFEARGNGGGLSIQMFPSASNMTRQAARVWHAGTRAGTEGHRVQAVSAALAQDAADFSGLSRHVMTQAWWASTVGNWLDKWSMGDKAFYARQERRKSQGYVN